MRKGRRQPPAVLATVGLCGLRGLTCMTNRSVEISQGIVLQVTGDTKTSHVSVAIGFGIEGTSPIDDGIPVDDAAHASG